MTNETAKIVQEVFERDLGSVFSMLEIKGMTKVDMCGIDAEVYTLVNEEGLMFVARVLKDVDGSPVDAFVDEMSLSRIEIPIKCKK